MAAIKRFEDIEAWQRARELVREVYKMCAEGRPSRDFNLQGQLCRAAVSCMSNSAEGFSRNGDKDFAHFLDIAKGSALEIQSLLYVALDLGYVEKSGFERLYELTDRVASLIGGLILYLRKRS
ncbi:MAG TPA: four helix bundle protein [Candidatus Binatia bacterium]|nr:four helix bundle protein [Candidatus Binatia bacterium]